MTTLDTADGVEEWVRELERADSGWYWITGPNGSGKSRFLAAVAARLAGAELVSAESAQRFYERELYEDDSNFQEGQDPGRLVGEILGAGLHHPLLVSLGLDSLLERGYRQLSSGEAQKTLLLEAVANGARYLFLDEPSAGLDRKASAELWRALCLVAEHVPLVIASAAPPNQNLPPFVKVANLRAEKLGLSAPSAPALDPQTLGPPSDRPLIVLRNGTLRYEQIVFSGLDWTVWPGEHTLLEGPNGSGKSSLLEMVSGDHPQAYANELYLFGRRRGTGESVWDIKKQVGLFSGHLHRDYRVQGSAFDVIVSGLFDSIGIYQPVEPSHVEKARAWWKWLALPVDAQIPFRELSFGFQRLVLLCRAAIKSPWLLLIDEPTVGLDEENRSRVLNLILTLTIETPSTVLFVSHNIADRNYWLDRISTRTLTLPVGRP
jgi:molybdate transport system ATP-binding protein